MPSEDEEKQAAEEKAEQAEAAAEEEAPGPEEPRVPLDVHVLLRMSVTQFAAVAWQKMGLEPDPLTNAIHKDLDQARLAIDAAAALAEKLLPRLQGQEARDLQSLLADLKLNFVKQQGSAESKDE